MRGMTLRIDCDAAPLIAALEAASALLAEASEAVLKSLEGLFGPDDASQQMATVQVDRAASAGAGELVVRLDPSDGLRRLLAAAGARDVD